jgi:hypothetical protein
MLKKPLLAFSSKGRYVENIWFVRDCQGNMFGEFREEDARHLCNAYNSSELFAELLMSAIPYIKKDADSNVFVKQIISALVEFGDLNERDLNWINKQ